MAKRTVKPPKVVTLGEVFRGYAPFQFKFTFVSKLARLIPERNYLQDGEGMFYRHLSAGNIVENGNVVGIFPGIPTYRIAKPDAPALI